MLYFLKAWDSRISNMTFLCVMNDMQLMKVMKVMEVMKIMTHGTLSNIMSELPGVHWAPFLASSEALVFIVVYKTQGTH